MVKRQTERDGKGTDRQDREGWRRDRQTERDGKETDRQTDREGW